MLLLEKNRMAFSFKGELYNFTVENNMVTHDHLTVYVGCVIMRSINNNLD